MGHTRNLRIENEMMIRNQSPSLYNMQQRSDLHVLAELFTGCIIAFQPTQHSKTFLDVVLPKTVSGPEPKKFNNSNL
jgi:hypothetical protein